MVIRLPHQLQLQHQQQRRLRRQRRRQRPTPTPTPGQPPPPATFGHNTLTDHSAVGGEPFIKVDKQDNIFVSSPFGVSTTVSLIWKSSDHGRTFIPLGSPIVRDGVVGPGGGDTHQDFDDMNRLYYSDLSAACVTVAVSEDGGNTFPPAQSNFLTCMGSEGEDVEGRHGRPAVGRSYSAMALLTCPFAISRWATARAISTWRRRRCGPHLARRRSLATSSIRTARD